MRKGLKGKKALPGDECIAQHKPLLLDLNKREVKETSREDLYS